VGISRIFGSASEECCLEKIVCIWEKITFSLFSFYLKKYRCHISFHRSCCTRSTIAFFSPNTQKSYVSLYQEKKNKGPTTNRQHPTWTRTAVVLLTVERLIKLYSLVMQNYITRYLCRSIANGFIHSFLAMSCSTQVTALSMCSIIALNVTKSHFIAPDRM
jgi:hypothetical protein